MLDFDAGLFDSAFKDFKQAIIQALSCTGPDVNDGDRISLRQLGRDMRNCKDAWGSKYKEAHEGAGSSYKDHLSKPAPSNLSISATI